MLNKIEHDSIEINKGEHYYLQCFYNSESAMDPEIVSIYNNKLNLSVYLSYKSIKNYKENINISLIKLKSYYI